MNCLHLLGIGNTAGFCKIMTQRIFKSIPHDRGPVDTANRCWRWVTYLTNVVAARTYFDPAGANLGTSGLKVGGVLSGYAATSEGDCMEEMSRNRIDHCSEISYGEDPNLQVQQTP